MLNIISTCRDILCVDINVDKRCVDHSTNILTKKVRKKTGKKIKQAKKFQTLDFAESNAHRKTNARGSFETYDLFFFSLNSDRSLNWHTASKRLPTSVIKHSIVIYHFYFSYQRHIWVITISPGVTRPDDFKVASACIDITIGLKLKRNKEF